MGVARSWAPPARAMLLHEPVSGFLFLDWIATASGKTGGGLGGARSCVPRRF